MTGDDEVTPNGELVHFSLLAGVKLINYREALTIKNGSQLCSKSYKQFKETHIEVSQISSTYKSYQSEMYSS